MVWLKFMGRKFYVNKSFIIKWAFLVITLSLVGHFMLFRHPHSNKDLDFLNNDGLLDHENINDFDSIKAKLPNMYPSRQKFFNKQDAKPYPVNDKSQKNLLPPTFKQEDINLKNNQPPPDLPVPSHRLKDLLNQHNDNDEGLIKPLKPFGLDQKSAEPLRFPEKYKFIPANDVKIDWHNYEYIEADKKRKGPGEQGTSYFLDLNNSSIKRNYSALYSVNGFNALASNYVSLNRSIPDIRHKDCRPKKYLSKLPTVSIVIPFHQEHWTTLLRSVHSIINRSPPELIQEIILVDDYSTKDFLKEPLDNYLKYNISQRYHPRVVRTKAREGLIRARIIGAQNATADVIIFLDSHIECNVNWLPPLLEPIAQNRQTVVCPFIDVVDYENFQYRAQDEGARGAFDWELFYKRLPLLKKDLENPTEPFDSPVMAGGLFAIDREYFWWLGGYDPGLQIWGGEQYELSFKIWQCGGRMVDAPCSRVGHIYRKFAPFPNPQVGDFVGKNYRRVADVWMDEYKEYILMRRPQYRDIDPGDLSEQFKIRQDRQCKPFKWFMENIAFDLPLKYPMIEPPDYANGEIRSVTFDLCLEVDSANALRVSKCAKDDPTINSEQKFIWTWKRDIKLATRDMCLDVPSSELLTKVSLFPCHGMKGNQWWKYEYVFERIKHVSHNMCLDFNAQTKEVYVNKCSFTDTQKWKFENCNKTIVDSLPN